MLPASRVGLFLSRVQCSSPASTVNSLKKFALFPKPQVVVPLMEISRKIGGNIAELIYQVAFEKPYSRDSLLIGANQGAALVSSCVADGNWTKLGSIASSDLIERLQETKEVIPDSAMQMLKFSPEDVVHSFLYSTVIAGKKIFKLSSSRNLGIYFTVVSFVRLNQTVPNQMSLQEATGKYRDDVLAVNITFARTLNPLGPWKATVFNVFTLND